MSSTGLPTHSKHFIFNSPSDKTHLLSASWPTLRWYLFPWSGNYKGNKLISTDSLSKSNTIKWSSKSQNSLGDHFIALPCQVSSDVMRLHVCLTMSFTFLLLVTLHISRHPWTTNRVFSIAAPLFFWFKDNSFRIYTTCANAYWAELYRCPLFILN